MKTTVEIPDDLFVQVKTAAAVRGMTFRDVLIHSLEAELAISSEKKEAKLMIAPERKMKRGVNVLKASQNFSSKKFPLPKLFKEWKTDPLLLLKKSEKERDDLLLH